MRDQFITIFFTILFSLITSIAFAQTEIEIALEKVVDKSSGQTSNLFFDVSIEDFLFNEKLKNPEIAMLSEGDTFRPVHVLRYENGEGETDYKVDTNSDFNFKDEKVLSFEKNGEILSADAFVQLRDSVNADQNVHFQVTKYKKYISGRITEFRRGSVTIDNNDFDIMLRPRLRTNPIYEISSGTLLFIDLNDDGSFADQWSVSEDNDLIASEEVNIAMPFKINGKTFELSEIDPAGTKITLKSTDKNTALVREFKVPNVEFKTQEGEESDLYSYLDRPILLEFWSTTCPYCESIRPELNEFYSSGKDSFHLLVFPRESDTQKIDNYLQEHPKKGIFLEHSEQLWDQFNPIGATPTFYLIDKDGSLLIAGRGASLLKPIKAMLSE